MPCKTQKVLDATVGSPTQHLEVTHPAVVIMVDRMQVPLQELVLRGDQHVTGQAVGSFYLLEEVLLANPC